MIKITNRSINDAKQMHQPIIQQHYWLTEELTPDHCMQWYQLPIAFFLILCLLCAGVAVGQTTYVFIGTFNKSAQKEGIAVYQLNQANGRLKKVSSVSGVLNPSFLSLANKGDYLYACTESQTKGSGYINSFKFDATAGKLTQINRQKTSGENPVYLTTDSSNTVLLSVNYTESGLDVFPLNGNEGIGSRLQSVAFTKGSGASERQQISHCHSVIFSPAFDHVLVPDLGADEIKSYRFNLLKRQPVEEETYMSMPAAPASGPRHISFHPNKKNVYCVEEIGGTIANYIYMDGRLQLVERLPLYTSTGGNYNSADVHISPDGKFLYASNRGDENNIAIFKIRQNGTLQPVGYQPTHGEHPRMFAISPDGRFLIVANQISNNITVFKRDEITGKLQFLSAKIKIKSPSCVQIRNYP